MFELLPYDYSDRPEFSEERLHGLLSDLNGEIIEREEDHGASCRHGEPVSRATDHQSL